MFNNILHLYIMLAPNLFLLLKIVPLPHIYNSVLPILFKTIV